MSMPMNFGAMKVRILTSSIPQTASRKQQLMLQLHEGERTPPPSHLIYFAVTSRFTG
jgi:hypothetical protein